MNKCLVLIAEIVYLIFSIMYIEIHLCIGTTVHAIKIRLCLGHNL